MKKLFFIVLFLLLSTNDLALAGTCWNGGSSGTAPWYVKNIAGSNSCEYVDVNYCVNTVANSGDTVVVPAGSSTWTTYVTIPNDKKITLQGAGKNSTVITKSPAGGVLALNNSGSRVTAIGFIDGSIGTYGNNFRIDHCKITFNTWNTGITIFSKLNDTPTGLIDNNEFNNTRVLSEGVTDMDAQHASWATPIRLGNTEAVIYVEDNIFNGASGAMNALDNSYAGATVFRYNTVYGQYIEVHSIQANYMRGVRKWEIYGNTIEKGLTPSPWPFNIRSGTGTIFNNIITGTWTYNRIILDNKRDVYDVNDNTTGAGACDGDNVWDGNQDATGWPCRDQIGRGNDSVQWDNSPIQPWAQTSAPAYFWGNKKESNVEVTALVRDYSVNHIKSNRDFYEYNASFNGTSGVGCGSVLPTTSCTPGVGFWLTNQSCSDLTGMVGPNPATPISGTLYKCTSTDTWTAYYTPYIYPHPLRSETTTPPVLTPETKDFGSITVNTPTDLQIFTVTNAVGSSDLNVKSITRSGSNPDQFLIENDTCSGQTVASGENCTFKAKFLPTTEGAKSADIVLTDTNDATIKTIPVNGTGVAAPNAPTGLVVN